MRRRQFIAIIGGATVAWPLAARSQSSGQTPRVSLLLGLVEKDQETKSRVRAFQLGMRDLGWIEGRNVVIDYRYAAGDPGQIDRYVKELIALTPNVIVGNSTPVLAALKKATSSIPIVFAVVNDPVGQGFISSLAHPGANITGFTFIDFEIISKWVSLLSDVVPNLHRVVLMFNPDTAPYYDSYLRSFKNMKQPALAGVETAYVRNVAEIDLTIAKLGGEPGGALIAPADIFIVDQRDAIIKAAIKYDVPMISVYRTFAVDGGLISYGPDTSDIFRRSSSYVDRILKGESAANLPAQSPTKYELVINLKTSKSLGLSVRESFIELADEVIE
jgi:putative ABC transport system substrate-binding protein